MKSASAPWARGACPTAGGLESAYEECLCKELEIRDIVFERQKPLVVVYKGITLDCGYKLDIVE